MIHVALVFDRPCLFANDINKVHSFVGICSGPNTLFLYHSEDSSEDMSCGEDSPWGLPGSDGEETFFPSRFLSGMKWWTVFTATSVCISPLNCDQTEVVVKFQSKCVFIFSCCVQCALFDDGLWKLIVTVNPVYHLK